MHSLLTLAVVLLTSASLTRCLLPSDIPRDTPVSSLVSSANAHLAKGNFNDALTYFDAAVSHDPQNYLTIFKRGATYLSLGKQAQAGKDFDRVLSIKPDFEGALLQRAKIRSKNADWVGARKDYAAAGKGSVGHEIGELQAAQGAAILAAEAEQKKDWEGCVSNAGLAILTASTALGLRQLRARCRFERGEVLEGISDLAHVLQISPRGSIEPHLQISAMLFYSMADTERGLDQIRKCLHADPDSKPCSKLFRREKAVEKRLKGVRQLMDKRQFNGAVKLLVKTGEDAGLIQDVKDEVHELREVGTIHQKAGDELYVILVEMTCQAYTEMNNHKKASPYCIETLQHSPHSLPGLLSRAQMAMEAEEYETAVSALQLAQQHHPSASSIPPLLHKAQTLLKQSRNKDYYKILGVARDADKRTIQRAYRHLTKIHHPDKVMRTSGLSKEEAEKKMASINEAYEVLSDPDLRARFDHGEDPMGHENQGSPFQGSPFFHHAHHGGGGGAHGEGQQQFVFRQGGGGGGAGTQFKFQFGQGGPGGGFQFPGGGAGQQGGFQFP